MIIIFNILFPVISIILLGYVIGKIGLFNYDFFPGINKLVYRFGITPLLFTKTATMSVGLSDAIMSISTILLLIIMLFIVSWLAATIFRFPNKMKGAFIHCSIRSNYAYIGLPVIFYAFSLTPIVDKATEIAIVIFTPAILFHNIMAILVLFYYREDKTNGGYFFIIKSLAKDPLILACSLGLLVNILGIHLPTAITRTGLSLGQMALPLALIGIGAGIDPKMLRGALFPPVFASLIKTVVSPFIMLGLMFFFGIGVHELHGKILLLLSACSVGIGAYVITEQYGGDEKLAGSSVFLSAVFSIVSLTAVLFYIH